MPDITVILLLEIIATFTGLGFVIGVIAEKKWAWPLGIVSSFLMCFVLYDSKLYSETILYIFYTIAGFYGWHIWSKEDRLQITQGNVSTHIVIIIGGAIAAFLISVIMKKYTDAARPLVDAMTSVFGVAATILEARKILSSWLFWIAINGVSFWLYFDREINVYIILIAVYFILSIYGYVQWRKKLISQ